MHSTRLFFCAAAWLVLFVCSSTAEAVEFHFTVTADMRDKHSAFGDLCQSINSELGDHGVFHVSIGDIDGYVWENRSVIDSRFGASAIWYPIIGNHEEEDGIEMEWLRNEYDNGNDVRTPLKEYTNQDGPTGTVRVNYSWDYGNAHFVAMNQYWGGGANEGSGASTSGSDTAADGNVVWALRTWLAADLAANTKPFVFVFGHEPAFPQYRHVGDSLDKYPAYRDAFWQILEDNDVVAFMNGHTHVYYKHLGDKNGVGDTWQIDVGNAGNESSEAPDGYTYLDVRVTDTQVTFDVWRDPDKNGTYVLQDSWTVVPEPGTLAMTVLAMLGLLASFTRRSTGAKRGRS